MSALRLGTRGSALAMAQSGQVAQALTEATGERVELVEIVTAGDRSDKPVQPLGVGVFVLASAGWRRLGREAEIPKLLHPLVMLPAPAQGAPAVECRGVDTYLVELLSRLDDEHTRAAVAAERSLLATLEAGCSAPVAALADVAEADD